MSDLPDKNVREQLMLPINAATTPVLHGADYCTRLKDLLNANLDFHGRDNGYASHLWHAFPAKFPPQLPRTFIEGLTCPGDVILDPMMGSGTTILEACLTGRRAIGLDIDPLALRIAASKTRSSLHTHAHAALQQILAQTRANLALGSAHFEQQFMQQMDEPSREFVRYWFAPSTAQALFFLQQAIQTIADDDLRLFFETAFSAIIITKSGGVSLAFDLAHTRPHRAKIVYDESGYAVLHENATQISEKRLKLLTKTLRSPLDDFEKRVKQNLNSMLPFSRQTQPPYIAESNAQALPLCDGCVDLIVTSPPYAANAIDYMRAHKFSLVWLGYPVEQLSDKRSAYIGGESVQNINLAQMPVKTAALLALLAQKDPRKANALHRYYSEMQRALAEMYRVLRPGKAAIVVVGTSVLRGIDIRIQDCLSEIGSAIGFDVPAIGVRNLERNRRMMPVGAAVDANSQIQQRMQQEFVIGFYKPQQEES